MLSLNAYRRPDWVHRFKQSASRHSVMIAALTLSACGTGSDSDPDTCAQTTCGATTDSTSGTGGDSAPGTSGGGPGAGGLNGSGSSVGGPGSGGMSGLGTGGLGSGGDSTGVPYTTSVTIEEEGVGQCSVDGAVEATNSGFSGSGYLNSDNVAGAGMEWAVDVGEAGTYTVEFAYASEPAEDRAASVSVNGTGAVANVSFPTTSSWSTWSTASIELISIAGENRIVLEASQASGLANIDSLTVSGAKVAAFDCTGMGSGGMGSGGMGSGGGENGDRCDIGVWDGSPPQRLSLSGSLGTHDPAVIAANGNYYRFDTGNFVPSFKSTNLTHWTNAGGVYSNATYPPAWLVEFRNQHNWTNSDNGGPWAPDVIYFGGKYHLYSSNSLFFGNNISCISHLTTTDIEAGNWQDQGIVVCTNGSEQFNAIDPEVELDENGTPWMAFGSFWQQAIQIIELDQDGNRVGNDFHHVAHAGSIEGPTLVRRCGYYYLFVTHGLCCPNDTEPARSINNIDYRTVVGRSQNILGPYVDKNGTPLTAGGGTMIVEGQNTSGVNSPYAAAGHGDVFIAGDKFYHAYHAYPYSRNPYAELRIVEMPFDENGWPVSAGTP